MKTNIAFDSEVVSGFAIPYRNCTNCFHSKFSHFIPQFN